ncbi:MAG: hypothetical protein HY918_02905 [Candidatus Doudnabacteria bacterium]|nr:hypothetical protein [Candidatus Doudnabacteria bacterium]
MRNLMFVAIVLMVMLPVSNCSAQENGAEQFVMFVAEQNGGLMAMMQDNGYSPWLYSQLSREPGGELLSCEEQSFEIRSISPGQKLFMQKGAKVDRGRLSHCLAVENRLFGKTKGAVLPATLASNSPAPSVQPPVSASPGPCEETKAKVVFLEVSIDNINQQLKEALAENDKLKAELGKAKQRQSHGAESATDGQTFFAGCVIAATFFGLVAVAISGVSLWRKQHFRTSWAAGIEYWLFGPVCRHSTKVKKWLRLSFQISPDLPSTTGRTLLETHSVGRLAAECGASVSPEQPTEKVAV